MLARASELALLAGGHWSASAMSCGNDDEAVARFADVVREILETAGGPYRAGYRRD